MTRLRRTPAAENDLLSIWTYIAAESIGAADRLLDRIADIERRLAAFPQLGVERKNLGDSVRAIFVRDYAVFYRLVDDTVEVLRVMDTRRDIGSADISG